MGFLGQAALHRASLARVQQRLGDHTATASYQRAIDDAAAIGDGRLSATARLNLARLLRDGGEHEAAVALLQENERWYRSAGGGEFALLTRCVLAAERNDSQALELVLEEVRTTDSGEVELFALDALARLAAEGANLDTARWLLAAADELAPKVAHNVDKSDRFDAALVRRLLRSAQCPHYPGFPPASGTRLLDASTARARGGRARSRCVEGGAVSSSIT